MTGTATCTKNLTVPNEVDWYSELGQGYLIPAYSID